MSDWPIELHDALAQRAAREMAPFDRLMQIQMQTRDRYAQLAKADKLLRRDNESLTRQCRDLRQQEMMSQQLEQRLVERSEEVAALTTDNVSLRADLEASTRLVETFKVELQAARELGNANTLAAAERGRLEQMVVSTKNDLARALDENANLSEEVRSLRSQLVAAGRSRFADSLSEADLSAIAAVTAARRDAEADTDAISSVPIGPIWTVDGPHGAADVYTVAIGPSDTIATAGAERVIRFWDMSSGRSTGTLNCSANVNSLDCRGGVLIAGCADATTRLFSLGGGSGAAPKSLAQLTGHSEPVSAVVLSVDAKTAVTASRDQTIRLWDLTRYELQRTVLCVSTCLDVTTSGHTLATAHFDGAVRLWDSRTGGKPARELGALHDKAITCVRFAHDGNTVATVGKDNALKLTDLRRTTDMSKTYVDQRMTISHNLTRFAISPDSRYCGVGSSSGELLFFDLDEETGARPKAALRNHHSTVTSVVWHATGRGGVVTVGLDRKLSLWR